MKIADFFAAIGFEVDDKAIAEADKKLENLRNQTLKLTAVLVGAVYAMDRFADSSIRNVVALTNFNIQTGLATEKLQKWQAAAQLSNMAIDANSVAQSIQAIQDNLTQIRLGQGNLAPFQLLGIDVRGQDAFSVLDQVRERIRGLAPSMQTNLLQQIGIDPNLLNVLRLSRKEFDELGNSIINTKETNDAIMRIGNSINMLKLRFQSFKDELVAKLEPVFMATVNILDRFGRAFDRIIGLMERFPAISAGAAAAIGVILIPFKSLAVILGTLFLLLEDIAVYFQGGKSITGVALEGIKEGFNEFREFLKGIGDWINDYIVVPVENAVLKIKDLIPGLKFGGGFISDENLSEGMKASISNFLNIEGLMGSVALRPNPSNLINNINSGSTSSGVTINNTFSINGESNLDVARDVARTIQEQLNYGLTDMNNGAAY